MSRAQSAFPLLIPASVTVESPQIIRPRIVLKGGGIVGPGKIDLLRAVHEHGSISAAGRALGMSYKRAWSLLNETGEICGAPVINAKMGGTGGGGAALTDFGRELIALYDKIELTCASAVEPHLATFELLLQRHTP
jgi:molybdate transport system regulatory protein